MKIMLKTFNLIKTIFPQLSERRLYSTAQALDPFQESELKQKLIIVNDNDEMIGSDTKYNCHRMRNGKIPLHRAFSVFIFNSKNEILLQQRSSCKVTFPNHVTNACCSHPSYDSYIYRDNSHTMSFSVARRLHFELGIPQSEFILGDLRFITKIHYFSEGDGTWGEHEIDHIFVLHKDLTIVPNLMEVKNVWSVPRNEFNSFIDNCEFPLTPWFAEIKKEWLFKIWDNLDNLSSIRDKKIQKFISE